MKIEGYLYKRHYEAHNSVYWICTLTNKYKCKQRVIADKANPYNVRFKGPGHNHDEFEYNNFSKISFPVHVAKEGNESDELFELA